MLRSLRRMRGKLLAEGQTGRYLRYAIGEMVLVVAGILIALQLNTANQQRLEQRKVQQYARTLIADLQADLRMLGPIRREIDFVHARIHGLEEYVRGKQIHELENVYLFHYTRAPFYRPYQWSRGTLEQMKTSGALRQIQDRALVDMISAYEGLTYHLEEDWTWDREAAGRAMALATRVVNFNYPNLREVFGPVDRSGPIGMDFLGSPGFQQYRELAYPLLTGDVNLVREMVNAFLVVNDEYGLEPRSSVEMEAVFLLNQKLTKALDEAYPVKD